MVKMPAFAGMTVSSGYDGVKPGDLRVRQKGGWVYIVTNRRDGTLYIGVTADLIRRLSEHRLGEIKCFTQKYWLTRLVYFDRHENILDAIAREKAMKKWLRAWKIKLIERDNPEWNDLYEGIL